VKVAMDLWRETRVDALLLRETVEEVARDMKWKDSIRGFLKKAREAIGIRTLEMEGMNNRQTERERENVMNVELNRTTDCC
jgi:hypothetical protein